MAIVHDGLTSSMREVVGGKKPGTKNEKFCVFATTDGITLTAHLSREALGANSDCLCIIKCANIIKKKNNGQVNCWNAMVNMVPYMLICS